MAIRHFGPALAGKRTLIVDFTVYYEAACRFLQDPATLYADYRYIYPPPSVLLFLPFTPLRQGVGYFIFAVLLTGVWAGCLFLFFALQESRGETLAPSLKTGLIMAGCATAPVFGNIKMTQVSVVMLLCGLGMLYLLRSKKPGWSGLVLALGIWLKLYPAVLGLIGGRYDFRSRYWKGMLLGLFAFPLSLMYFFPMTLYQKYVLLLSRMGGQTNRSVYNQSLLGVWERIPIPIQSVGTLPLFEKASATGRGIVIVAAVALIGYLYVRFFRNPRSLYQETGYSLLAAIPIFSPLGWGHTYVLALPLALYVLLLARDQATGWQALVVFSFLGLMVPKFPRAILLRSFAYGPGWMHKLIHARFLLVTLFFMALAVAWSEDC